MNHGTSQIDNVLAGVQHLCNELGPMPGTQTMQDVGAGENEAGFMQGGNSKSPASCPQMRPHRVLQSCPAETVVVLTMSVSLTTCDVM